MADIEHPTRHPLDPILDHLGIRIRHDGGGNRADQAEGLHAVAIRLGISHRHARRLAVHGLDERQADRYAIRLGLHPTALWPDWWDIDDHLEEGDDGIMREAMS